MRSRTKVCPNNRLTPANVGESVGKSTVGRVRAEHHAGAYRPFGGPEGGWLPAEFRRLAIEEDLRAKKERSANAPAVQSK